MQPSPTFRQIDIKDIDLSDEWNIHPFLAHEPSPRLLHSIQSIGLLRPIIVRKRPDNRYQLLCGRNRLVAHRTNKQTPTPINALILDEETPPQRVLHYLLEDQLISGTLSPMEKAYFFKYCLKYMKVEKAAHCFLPLLKEKVQPHRILQTLPLLDLEPEIQKNIHIGKIGERIALDLLLLTADDRLALYWIFQELELGGGKQKRLLALTKDLALGQGKTIATLLAEPDFSLILDHPEMNRPQKASALLTTLQKKLSPESSAAEENFRKTVSQMQLPPACSISHSPAFEKDEVYVTLRFYTLKEVENRLRKIKAIAE